MNKHRGERACCWDSDEINPVGTLRKSYSPVLWRGVSSWKTGAWSSPSRWILKWAFSEWREEESHQGTVNNSDKGLQTNGEGVH